MYVITFNYTIYDKGWLERTAKCGLLSFLLLSQIPIPYINI